MVFISLFIISIVSHEYVCAKTNKESKQEHEEHRQSDVLSSFRDEPCCRKIFIPMFYHNNIQLNILFCGYYITKFTITFHDIVCD